MTLIFREEYSRNKIKEFLDMDCEFGFIDANISLVYDKLDKLENVDDQSIGEAFVMALAEGQLGQNRGWQKAVNMEMAREFPTLAGLRSNEMLIKRYYQLAHPGQEMQWDKLKVLLRRPAEDARYGFFFAEPSHSLATNELHDRQQAQLAAEKEKHNQLKATLRANAKLIAEMTANLKTEIQQQRVDYLQSLSAPELQNTYDVFTDQQRLQAMSVPEIRAEVRQQAADRERGTFYTDSRGTKYEVITEEFEVPGKIGVTVPWSAKLLKLLDPNTSRKLLGRFGNEQLTAVINKQ